LCILIISRSCKRPKILIFFDFIGSKNNTLATTSGKEAAYFGERDIFRQNVSTRNVERYSYRGNIAGHGEILGGNKVRNNGSNSVTSTVISSAAKPTGPLDPSPSTTPRSFSLRKSVSGQGLGLGSQIMMSGGGHAVKEGYSVTGGAPYAVNLDI
jgi:hypothetical protein